MHHVHLNHTQLNQEKTLHAIVVCSNPIRFKSRYNLHKDFIARLFHGTHHEKLDHHYNLNVIVVEMAFGNRPFEITDSNNPNHVQVRCHEELWHKENLINLGVRRLTHLHPDWKYMAWIDGDVQFQRHDFVTETVHQLQHYQVVQMWEHAIDIGPNHETVDQHTSFMSQYVRGLPRPKYGQYGSGKLWHPGYAWACTREAYDFCPILDIAILGAGDNHMAYGLIGCIKETFPKNKHGTITQSYQKLLEIWGERAVRYINYDVGFVSGTLIHHWHGKKRDRRYWDRWQILVRNEFDPSLDLKLNAHGLYQIEDLSFRQRRLRDEIRGYFRARNEDSIDLE